jgi:hypothetical protein
MLPPINRPGATVADLDDVEVIEIPPADLGAGAGVAVASGRVDRMNARPPQ